MKAGPFHLPAGLEEAALQIDLDGTYHEENELPFQLSTLHQSGFAQALTWLCIATEDEGVVSPWDQVDLTDQLFPHLEDLSMFFLSIKGRSSCLTNSHGLAEDVSSMHAEHQKDHNLTMYPPGCSIPCCWLLLSWSPRCWPVYCNCRKGRQLGRRWDHD